MANMSVNLNVDAQNSLACILVHSLFTYVSTVTLTFDVQNR